MSTLDDQASDREEEFREQARRYRKPVGPPATGECLFCGEEVGDGMRWCNVDCHADWEMRQ